MRLSTVTVIVIVIVDTFAFPLLNSFGYDRAQPGACTCDDGLGPGATNDVCNEFNFLSGFLIFPGLNGGSAIGEDNPFIDMMIKSPPNTISASAFEAMWIATAFSYTDAYVGNISAREKAYEFCTFPSQSCSIVTINTFDIVRLFAPPPKLLYVNCYR